MDFGELQPYVFGLLENSNEFMQNQYENIFEDFGTSKAGREAKRDLSTNGPGWAIAVWPVVALESNEERGGEAGGDALVVVRLEVNPQFLATLPDSGADWLSSALKAVAKVVLSSDGGDLSQARFTLARHAIELMVFDEGLVAYHIRFKKFCVVGQQSTTDAGNEWTADSYKSSDSL